MRGFGYRSYFLKICHFELIFQVWIVVFLFLKQFLKFYERHTHVYIKMEPVKTSKSVPGINSDVLTEKSKTSGLIQWKDFLYSFIVLHEVINVNTIEKN